ncbi:hypothetical protein [Novosphingopyxis sp.]|uniref:hypothetical protein n=1 Tax=Novosphingopyxis sp. TaxID=2709690 RepID=UPI003B59D9D0
MTILDKGLSLASVKRHLFVAAEDFCRYRGPMSFAKLDHLIGKKFFVLPIINLCQLTRQSQFAVARLFWFIAACDGFYHAKALIGSLIWGGISVIMMVSAGRRADSPTASFMFFRLLAVLMLIIDLIRGAAPKEWAGIEFWIFVLPAEYAANIRTIPPTITTKSTRQVSKAN